MKHVLERLDRSGSLLTATVSTKVNKAIQLPSTSSAQPQNQLQMTRAPQFNQQVLEIPQANESVSQFYTTWLQIMLLVTHVTEKTNAFK